MGKKEYRPRRPDLAYLALALSEQGYTQDAIGEELRPLYGGKKADRGSVSKWAKWARNHPETSQNPDPQRDLDHPMLAALPGILLMHNALALSDHCDLCRLQGNNRTA